jgi:hypothetical protein
MFLVTKWWFALPVDGPDKFYWGFPFAFMGEGFHTSMSFQFFILEFIIDFTFYFSFWLLLFFIILKWRPNIKVYKSFSIINWSLMLIFVFGFGLLIRTSNPIFHVKRNYDWQVMKTGYLFLWQTTPALDSNQYHP